MAPTHGFTGMILKPISHLHLDSFDGCYAQRLIETCGGDIDGQCLPQLPSGGGPDR